MDSSSTTGQTLSIKLVDAFTATPLTGNPAGVVLEADGLSDEQMQGIAREMAVPETAFILQPTSRGADLRIRWFTPRNEVPLCGHATIASFHALAEEGMRGMGEPGSYTFGVETLSGILPVTVEKLTGGSRIRLGLPVPEFVYAEQLEREVMHLLGISVHELEPHLPIVAASYLYVPVRQLASVHGLSPKPGDVASFLSANNLGGLCVFTRETVDPGSAVHSRFFAPNQGIDEDPVTGTANGPLGAYMVEQNLLVGEGGDATIVGEQGDILGRRGRVSIHLRYSGTEVESVAISGTAVTALDGTLRVR